MLSNSSANCSAPVICHWVMRFVPVQMQGVMHSVVDAWPPLQGSTPSKLPHWLAWQ